ncbi:MAG: hypothetical protein JXR37_21130 [Kiritimatiellae bacterium]|nr:hypothetical protein [Kiritimatiellia bacterium]
MIRRTALPICCGLAALLLAGCVSPPAPAARRARPSASLTRAEALYEAGDYTGALIECIDIGHRNPDTPGLVETRHRVLKAMSEQRANEMALRRETSRERAVIDLERSRVMPDTYGQRRFIRGLSDPTRTEPSPMEKALERRVTLHLDSVNLDTFILALGASENVNIIADAMDTTKTMTVHADDVPLGEILDYVARNLGVAFYLGENLIWATPKTDAESPMPLETRMYRLRKGISGSTEGGAGNKIKIVDAIERFVPKVPGGDLMFDPKSHVLIVKNTRANLALIEALIAGLDVCPPQVLIEARFVGTTVTDLRELGIDWLLNSPLTVTRTKVLQNGTEVTAPQTQINEGGSVSFTPFANQVQGLNLTYQGLLTDPMFQAVLHALDVSGKAQTLSVPKVTTVNNHPAMIRVGEDFRFFEEFDTVSVPTVTDDGTTVYTSMLVPVGKPQLEELGIELSVIPSLGADMRTITLSLKPEISEFVRFEEYEVGLIEGETDTTTTNGLSMVKLPIFRRSIIETEVLVQSGETVVMGGLVTATGTEGKSQVPFLGAIPLLGRLFQRDSIQESRQNLLIFVTATIVTERGEDLVPMERIPAADASAPVHEAPPVAAPAVETE